MTEGLIAFVRRKNGNKKAKSIIEKKSFENSVFFKVQYKFVCK